MEKLKVCIIIPAYNEEKVIRKTVEEVLLAAKNYISKNKQLGSFSIVVIDDKSTDRTAAVAGASGATVIRHLLNTGAGGATATGLYYAKKEFDIAVTMDADGQHLPQDVINGIEALLNGSSDILVGSRLLESTGMSSIKKIGNRGLSTITNILFGLHISDTQSGLRIFSRRAIELISWKSQGFEFCSEMLWRAKQLGLRLGEYPIKAVYTDYSVSKGQNNWNAINIIKNLIGRRFSEFLQ